MTQGKDILIYKRDSEGHYLCDKCGYRTPSKHMSTMHYHMKKHTNDFPYECSICKCGFAQKQTLHNHMKARHPEQLKEKENPFKCPIQNCPFESITKGNCLIHCARRHNSELVDSQLTIQVAEGKKIYHCECCTKDFKSPTAYYYHILKCLNTFQLLDTNVFETLM
jgi:hypothetical protein